MALKAKFGVSCGQFETKKSAVIEVDSESSVNDAFKVLVANNLLSVPCFNKASKKYVGFFDILDAVSYATHVHDLFADRNHAQHKIGEKVTDRYWFPLPSDTPMLRVLELLSTKCRRVPIIDANTGKVTKVISQSLVTSTMNECFVKFPAEIPPAFKKTPRETKFGLKQVLTLSEEVTAKEAFDCLVKHNHSAIGITSEEEDGKIIACITAKDLRVVPSITEEGEATVEELMALNVMDFVSKARMQSEKNGKSHPAVAVGTLDTPFVSMVAKLAKTGMHRIFLVDDKAGDHRAVGVFSVGDAVALLHESVVKGIV